MGIKCYHCGSENTHFKQEVTSDCCCNRKEGEEWFCRDCQSVFSFHVVYSGDGEDLQVNQETD